MLRYIIVWFKRQAKCNFYMSQIWDIQHCKFATNTPFKNLYPRAPCVEALSTWHSWAVLVRKRFVNLTLYRTDLMPSLCCCRHRYPSSRPSPATDQTMRPSLPATDRHWRHWPLLPQADCRSHSRRSHRAISAPLLCQVIS